MLEIHDVAMQFGGRTLFKEVNLSFQKGNCYGIIGANGAGKTTFLKILSGELEPTSGSVSLTDRERMSVLKQNQNAYDDLTLVDTVIQGHPRLVEVMKEREELYAKSDFSEADGLRAGELENEFAELDGWNADSEARSLLSSLGIDHSRHDLLMREIEPKEKVKVLLAQALFGNPDILLLDEPTNNLDMLASQWLENFLYGFPNTVIIVSHDRYFLNKVCTRILDVDYGSIRLYIGNYAFWYESSQLIQRQMRDSNMKKEQRIKELQEFIARFSANASKSRQATSRKRELEKIELDDLIPSSRVYPFIDFRTEREIGNDVLDVEDLSAPGFFSHLCFSLKKNQKVAFLAKNSLAVTTLFRILTGEEPPGGGRFKFGITVKTGYLPADNSPYFQSEEDDLIAWLRPYSKDQNETYLRGWLGRMLFSNEEALKKAKVLSGGERVRCMLTKLMLESPNLILMDDPTNHLDLESVSSLNKAMIQYKGVLLFTSHDHELIQSVADRILFLAEDRFIDFDGTYDEFIEKFGKEL